MSAPFKPGDLVRTRHRIGSCGLEDGAEGRVLRVDAQGYVYVLWNDGKPHARGLSEMDRGIHYEHLKVVR